MKIELTDKLAFQYPIPVEVDSTNVYWNSGWGLNIWVLTKYIGKYKRSRKGIGKIERYLGFMRWRKYEKR